MRVRELRKQLGISQEQLALLVGVKQATISLWESENAAPSMKNILKLMGIFNCTSDELLDTGGTEKGVPQNGNH